jgi:hypothetical protein
MDNQWASPLKQKKEAKPPPPPPTREEATQKILKAWRKKKCVITPGAAKKILGIKFADSFICDWVARWIETLVSSNGYPPQLNSNQFYSLIRTYFSADKAFEILSKARLEYRLYFPTMDEAPEAIASLLENQRNNTENSILNGNDDSQSLPSLCIEEYLQER